MLCGYPIAGRLPQGYLETNNGGRQLARDCAWLDHGGPQTNHPVSFPEAARPARSAS